MDQRRVALRLNTHTRQRLLAIKENINASFMQPEELLNLAPMSYHNGQQVIERWPMCNQSKSELEAEWAQKLFPQ